MNHRAGFDGELFDQFQVAADQSRFRDQADRVAEFKADFKAFARELVISFERDVRIGSERKDQHVALPALLHELRAQQLRRANLGDDLSLEIGPRAEAEVLVRGPRETVRAGVRTTAIAIDRIIERNVWAVIAGDDRTRGRLFKDFELGFGRFADPFVPGAEPGVRRCVEVSHNGNARAGPFSIRYITFVICRRPRQLPSAPADDMRKTANGKWSLDAYPIDTGLTSFNLMTALWSSLTSLPLVRR